jgi:acyl-coenzyme A synthetase/AMP-(fatty) acid ligase
MNLVDMVYFWARTMPERPAIIQPEGVIAYRVLAQAIEAAAQHFALNIPDRSKPVTVSLPSSAKMLVACLGLLRAGISIVVALPDQLEQVPLEESNSLVIERGQRGAAGRMNIWFDDSWLRSSGGEGKTIEPLPQPKTRNADIYFFTSGTTGRPKQVVRTQDAWDRRMMFNLSSAYVDYDRALCIPPMTTGFGFTRAYEVLYAGKTLCFAPIGEPTLWLANTFDVDQISASTQQALGLAAIQAGKSDPYPLAALKSIRIGGSVLSKDGIDRIKSYLCRNIIIDYSSTEAGVIAVAPHDMIADIPNAVGFVAPDAEIQIIDAEGRLMPAGSEGFVRLRTMQYIANLKIENPDTWLYPGDVGWLTENNVLCIAGRTGDVVNRGGAKVSIGDFEDFLRSCPGVHDAGVCTLMGTSGFDEIWIGLVLQPAADIGALRAKIESSRQFGSNIDKLFVVESIPRGSLGKVQREELKEMLQGILKEGEVST